MFRAQRPWTGALTTGHSGLGRQPFSEYPSLLCAEGLPEASLQPEGGSRGWTCLGAGKEAGPCSVVPEEKLLSDGMLVEAREASEEDLLVVHTRRYLNELKVQFHRDLRAQP